MVVFKSLIVFDSETTSLPQFDHNTTKVTELAFIGCEIEHLKNSKELPRVLHKLVLVFNPNKAIQPEASKVSGLSNELVVNVQPFREEDVDILKHFISRLPPPVCIVAHNGDNFDFPILRRALSLLKKNLQNNVYCADSFKAFKTLLPKVEQPLWTRRSDMIAANETTPTNQRTQPINMKPVKKVCRALFKDDDGDDNEMLADLICSQVDEHLITSQSSASVPRSYKLSDIYYFYFRAYFEDAHRAEEDSKALLGCIKMCNGFIEWMNKNAVVFNSIEPLF